MKDDYNCCSKVRKRKSKEKKRPTEENSKFEVILDDILFKRLKRDKGRKGGDTERVRERAPTSHTRHTLNLYKYFLALARTRLSKTLLRIIL